MNKYTHDSNNHNIQFFKTKFQNNFLPIANIFFIFLFLQIIVLLPNLHLFSYKNNSNIVIRGNKPC